MQLLISLLIATAFAQENIPPENQAIFFSKVSFKDKTADFIELQVTQPITSPLTIKDDSILTTILPEELFGVNKVTILFKQPTNSKTNTEQHLIINLTKSGLTGTTEQLTLLDQDSKILDGLCWSNATIAKGELDDVELFLGASGWAGPCLDSDALKNNDQIHRLSRPLAPASWQIIKAPEKTKTKSTSKASINNGPQTLKINEIMPNPKGKDTGKEWIEILNYGNSTISSKGWTLKLNGKKRSIKTKNFPPNSLTKVLLTLNNSSATMTLTSPSGATVDSINYANVEEDKAFSKTNLGWYWLTPTPSSLNPKLAKVFGKITKTYDEKTKSIELNGKPLKIETRNSELTKTLLNIGTEISGTKIEGENTLIDYQIVKMGEQTKSPSRKYINVSVILLGLAGILMILKKLRSNP